MSKRNSANAAASSLTIFAKGAYELEMLGKEKPALSRIYYAPATVLQEKDLQIVE